MKTAKTIPKTLILLTSMILVLGIAIVDHISREDISAYIFYTVPIFLSCWFAGLGYGIVISICCSFTWFLLDLTAHLESYSRLVYWNAFIRTVFFIGMSYTLHSLRSAFEREKLFGHKDYLTGIANRRSFFELGEIEIKRGRRKGTSFTVAFIDLDNFKAVNDRFGHQEGDRLLFETAQVLRMGIRATDIVARFGGDEFILLLVETTPEIASEIINKLKNQIHLVMEKNHWDVSCSIGANTYITPPQNVDKLILDADRLLLAAKQRGKGVLLHEVVGAGT